MRLLAFTLLLMAALCGTAAAQQQGGGCGPGPMAPDAFVSGLWQMHVADPDDAYGDMWRNVTRPASHREFSSQIQMTAEYCVQVRDAYLAGPYKGRDYRFDAVFYAYMRENCAQPAGGINDLENALRNR